VSTQIPSSNLDRTKDFYVNKLGLAFLDLPMPGVMGFVAGKDTRIYAYERSATHAEHTLAVFNVNDLESQVEELSKKGVIFEHYDSPQLKTDGKGIVTRGSFKAAWFKDPDGNILGITQG